MRLIVLMEPVIRRHATRAHWYLARSHDPFSARLDVLITRPRLSASSTPEGVVASLVAHERTPYCLT
jgi:hypothetical protein